MPGRIYRRREVEHEVEQESSTRKNDRDRVGGGAREREREGVVIQSLRDFFYLFLVPLESSCSCNKHGAATSWQQSAVVAW